MAVTHNFKEGIDWAADATGETPLANHIFVSKSGNDGTGDGSPQTPYLTIAKAHTEQPNNNYTIVVGAGSYTIVNLNLSAKTTRLICDGYVIFTGNGIDNGFQLANSASSTVNFIKGAIFFNFGNVRSIWGGTNSAPRIIECTLVNSNYGFEGTAYVSVVQVEKCIFINSIQLTSSTGTNGGSVVNSIYINSPILRTRAGDSIKNCFFDQNSSFTSLAVSVEIKFNAFNGSFTNASTGTVSNNYFNITPFFNNKSGFDLSVSPSSQLIAAGENGANIGAVFIGKGYFQGVPEMDEGVDSNTNIAFNSLGELELQAGSSAVETFETGEEEALELSVMGAINISGFLDLVNNTPDTDNTLTNPNQLILEINVAQLDGIFEGWKKYRWNERPTLNGDGTSNGESDYDWSDNQPLRWKKRKFRISLRSNYTSA